MSKDKEKKVKENKERRVPAKAVPLLVFASVLSVASLSWTTYSLLDLLKVGAIGLTVAATADVIWSAVIWCEYKGIGSKGWVKTIGWIAVAVVGAFIAWHGASKGSVAMAVAGPFLTLGTKAVWELALVALKDEVKEKKEISAKEIALLDAETDTILERAEAQIRKERAENEAEHRRKLDAKRRAHEEKMADLRYAAEEKKAENENRTGMLVDQIENSGMERIIGILERQNAPTTLQGETVPQPGIQGKQLHALGSAPQTAVNRPAMLTVSINNDEAEPLTEAQEGRKRLAALYYLYEDEAQAKDQHLTQTAYADMMGTNKVMVSRACKEFPRGEMSDIEAYREEMGQTG